MQSGGGKMKEAVKQVSSLVDRFQRNIDAYRNPAYNETQLRIEFLQKKSLQGQIEATDQQIDRLVYDLYGLTDQEIKIVEEGAK